MMDKKQLKELNWVQPPVPEVTEFNPREFYFSEEYLEWFNNLDRVSQRLHQPKTIEKRAKGLMAKGASPSQFGLLTDSGTYTMSKTEISLRNTKGLTTTQRRIIGKQLETQEKVLAHLRSLVSSDDVERVYDTLTEQAVATGDAKLLDTWLRFMVGQPAQQINVTKVDVASVLEAYAARAEAEREEYRVVDAETP